MKKILGVLFALVLVGVFGGTLYFLWAKSQEKPIVYETREPFRTDIVRKTVATGSIVPRNEIEIKPNVSGIIEQIYVEPGEIVTIGDLLTRVRIVPDIGQLANAENRVNRAEIALENARNEYRRNKELFEEGVLAQADYVVFELDLRNAEEELDAAEDSLAVIREGARKKAGSATNTLVRATIAGMVLEVPVEVGNSVIESNTFNDGTTIASIADMDEMIFEGKVDESEVGKLSEGMDLLLTIGAIEESKLEAVLEYIAPKGVEENGAIQFEIRAALKKQDEVFIRANYSANADVVLERVDDALAVQEAWIQFDGREPFVEVETADQEFERRKIETGLSDGINIQVVAGLDEGEKVKDPNSGRGVG